MASSVDPQSVIHGQEDIWIGKTDPAERRRIQNRLSQRTWRARRKLEKQQQQQQQHQHQHQEDIEEQDVIEPPMRQIGGPYYHRHSITWTNSNNRYSNEINTLPHQQLQLRQRLQGQDHQPPAYAPGNARVQLRAMVPRLMPKDIPFKALAYFGQHRRISDVSASDVDRLHRLFLQQAEEAQRRSRTAPDPLADQLIPLVQFNVFRGMLQNITILGIHLSSICDDEAVSPFGLVEDGPPERQPTASAQRSLSLAAVAPAALRPTPLQLATRHHPWLDFFPVPRMRDNLIMAGEAGTWDEDDEDQLCVDMIGFCTAPSEKPGLVVWGEPWEASSWEVSEEFLSNWRWVVEGCVELMASTNHWRAKRGERALQF